MNAMGSNIADVALRHAYGKLADANDGIDRRQVAPETSRADAHHPSVVASSQVPGVQFPQNLRLDLFECLPKNWQVFKFLQCFLQATSKRLHYALV